MSTLFTVTLIVSDSNERVVGNLSGAFVALRKWPKHCALPPGTLINAPAGSWFRRARYRGLWEARELSPGIRLEECRNLKSYKRQVHNDTIVSEAPVPSKSDVPLENTSPAAESTSQVNSAIDPSAVVQPDAIAATIPVDPTSASALSDSAVDVLSNVASTVPAMQYGDMSALGLVSWSPAGFFPWLLEVTQVSTGLPWWGVIILTTVGVRIAVLPLIIRSQRSQGRLAPVQPLLAEARAKVEKARAAGDQMAMQQAMIHQHSILKKAGVNPLDAILTSITQVCVQIGFFFGLRRMCDAPVVQLQSGGFSWITDLTVADPYYISPMMNFALINLQLYVSRRDMLALGSPAAPHFLNGLRVLTAISIPFMIYFPSALHMHFITSISFIAAQTLILRIPALPTFKDTIQFIKDYMKKRAAEAQVEQAERMKKIARAVKAPPQHK
ncbi:hypothetical protein EW145_g3267 [Phellinidium pouzarii]|uniref:Membrane insertase YidC/Oxa/ALB C-terminal domain-containing protein n=1 Tax=Phellinidium pouzarii TaxID=167371 RepID=A0A4S4L7Y8_9AGAM|nr:hypothetical protein EW145_g3267 [Phellinidium pouzarii]